MIREESTIEGLIGVLKSMHVHKDDVLIMELYYPMKKQTHNLLARVVRMSKRISIKYKKQDAWLGVYWDSLNVWICLIPFFPIKILRESKCYECGKGIKGEYGGKGWHKDKKWVRYSQYTDELVTCYEYHKINEAIDGDCS